MGGGVVQDVPRMYADVVYLGKKRRFAEDSFNRWSFRFDNGIYPGTEVCEWCVKECYMPAHQPVSSVHRWQAGLSRTGLNQP